MNDNIAQAHNVVNAYAGALDTITQNVHVTDEQGNPHLTVNNREEITGQLGDAIAQDLALGHEIASDVLVYQKKVTNAQMKFVHNSKQNFRKNIKKGLKKLKKAA